MSPASQNNSTLIAPAPTKVTRIYTAAPSAYMQAPVYSQSPPLLAQLTKRDGIPAEPWASVRLKREVSNRPNDLLHKQINLHNSDSLQSSTTKERLTDRLDIPGFGKRRTFSPPLPPAKRLAVIDTVETYGRNDESNIPVSIRSVPPPKFYTEWMGDRAIGDTLEADHLSAHKFKNLPIFEKASKDTVQTLGAETIQLHSKSGSEQQPQQQPQLSEYLFPSRWLRTNSLSEHHPLRATE